MNSREDVFVNHFVFVSFSPFSIQYVKCSVAVWVPARDQTMTRKRNSRWGPFLTRWKVRIFSAFKMSAWRMGCYSRIRHFRIWIPMRYGVGPVNLWVIRSSKWGLSRASTSPRDVRTTAGSSWPSRISHNTRRILSVLFQWTILTSMMRLMLASSTSGKLQLQLVMNHKRIISTPYNHAQFLDLRALGGSCDRR